MPRLDPKEGRSGDTCRHVFALPQSSGTAPHLMRYYIILYDQSLSRQLTRLTNALNDYRGLDSTYSPGCTKDLEL